MDGHQLGDGALKLVFPSLDVVSMCNMRSRKGVPLSPLPSPLTGLSVQMATRPAENETGVSSQAELNHYMFTDTHNESIVVTTSCLLQVQEASLHLLLIP